MNRNQRIALGIGVAVIVLASLFPPWVRSYSFSSREGRIEQPEGYHFLLSGPSGLRGIDSARVDYGRLGIQYVIIAAVTATAIVFVRPAKE